MFGGTLRDLRERIADRHEDDGRYYVNCARTGERPVPVAGKRFPTRETAVAAAELAAEYRAELRRYDPRLPHYDLVVSEAPGADGPVDSVLAAEKSPRSTASPDAATASGCSDLPGSVTSSDSGSVSDFCHDVSAAVFEALSELGETEVERAALEAYLHSAESVTDPDELCLVLLATIATEIDARLASERQEAVLRAAADRLGTPSGFDAPSGCDAPPERSDPMTATLARLDDHSLVGDYAVSRDRTSTGRWWRISVEGYAFDGADGRVPTLPLAVELLRRLPDEAIAVSDLRATGKSGWNCIVSTDAGNARALSLATPENV
jgi:hypothetical protein